MRDITFRARRTDNGEWVEGNLVWIKNCNDEPYQCFIISHLAYMEYGEFDDTYQVLPETVGQYTGLTDKNGKKIFEGDIVKHYNNSDDGFDVGMLYWDETFSQWKRTSIGNFHHRSFTYSMSRSCDYEVIGNIHDNPELLEVK